MKTAVILLAGGQGTRFGGPTPKQFITLGNQPLIEHSLHILKQLSGLIEMVVVCAPQYRHYFPSTTSFAIPGARRQDSVYHGLLALKSKAEYILIHDGARPFITLDLVNRVLDAAQLHGAATAGMPLKFTVKQHGGDHFVMNTPDRTTLWEIQTPQVVRRDWLEEGFAKINAENITITDDVSIAEHLGHPVKLVEGSYHNIKITTPEDVLIAHQLLGQTNG